MSVYQVEQYYCHMCFSVKLNDADVAHVKSEVENLGYDDFSVGNVDMTVDGFESDSDAELFETEFEQNHPELFE